MKKLIALFLLFNLSAQARRNKWPDHKKAVIVLTYDDGLLSQLNIAVPQLDALHFKATFFLIGDINNKTIPRWRALAKRGFELGNHTLFHPCTARPDNPVPSEHYTLFSIIHEVEIMNHLLYAVDGETNRTYAYPCTETSVGGKSYVDTLRKSKLVNYARVGGDADAIITNFRHLDLLQIPAYGLDDNTKADQLIAFVKNVQKHGGMGIFMFHGIGGDYITTSAAAHQALLNYLDKNRSTIWVTTFQQAMDYAKKFNR